MRVKLPLLALLLITLSLLFRPALAEQAPVNPFVFVKPPAVGAQAPAFSVKSATGEPVSLAQYRNRKNVVLIFYQGHFCTVCGHQLANLQRHYQDFQAQQAEVIAISADPPAEAQKTVALKGLSFPVIPDPDKTLIRRYGVANAARAGLAWPSALVIDKKGIVRMSLANAQAYRVHSSDLLPVLSKLTGKPAPKLGYED